MGVTGAFGKLRSLIGKLQSVASGSLTRKEGELMKNAEFATREALTECFLYQRDPQGVAWSPRKHVYGNYRDTNPILFDLLSGFVFQVFDGKVKVTNIKPVLGTLVDPKLPEGSIDLVLLVDVYHEFSHPEQMLAAIRKSLKPTGRVALVEFRAEDPAVPIKPLHKMLSLIHISEPTRPY